MLRYFHGDHSSRPISVRQIAQLLYKNGAQTPAVCLSTSATCMWKDFHNVMPPGIAFKIMAKINYSYLET